MAITGCMQMFTSFWFWIVVILLPSFGALYIYNRLVKHRQRVREAWSGIDVQLKRRHELIPRLVDVVKAYAAHESVLLENVARVRTQGVQADGLPASETAEQEITMRLRPILALAEAYPNLKANGNYLQLQNQLVEVENVLQMARRYYNGTVRDYNTLIEMFPGNLVAGLGRFAPKDYFEIEVATERQAPTVDMDG